MRYLFGGLAAAFALALLAGTAPAQSPVFVDEEFDGAMDPLTYWYQDPAVSTDSFAWSDPNDNMSGQARRGRSVASTALAGTAERASVTFDATGYYGGDGNGDSILDGDGDKYLEYTECFSFSFDLNFSTFVAAANDERLMAGFWYSPADADDEPPPSGTDHFLWYANRMHFVGATIEEDGSAVRFEMIFSNSGNFGGRSTSVDLTGAGSLSTGVNYRIIGHYGYDGIKYGQLFGELWDLDTNTLVGSIAQATITSDTDVYDAAFINNSTDTLNRRFMELSQMGVGNETSGSTQMAGPQFTSDNWSLTGCNPIPEPGVMALAGIGLFGLYRSRRRK